MKFTSLSPRDVEYASVAWHKSEAVPGVKFAVRRVSLGERLQFTSRVRDLGRKYDFLSAGNAMDQLEASMADLLVNKLYLEWCLAEVTGLKIDGIPATAELLVEKGPEELVVEIVSAGRAQLSLSEDERKNS